MGMLQMCQIFKCISDEKVMTTFVWEIVLKNWHDNINTDPQC